MSDPNLPPAQVVPPAPSPPPASNREPSADDAEARVRQMRVEARLPRIVALGATLGAITTAAGLWSVYADEALHKFWVALDDYPVRVTLTAGSRFMTAVGLALVAFYSLRLWVQSHPSALALAPRAVEENLRKIRRLLTGCLFVGLTAVVTSLMLNARLHGTGMALLYGACCIGCGLVIGDVRKALGEYETAEERARKRVTRGFEVELRPRAAAAAPAAVPALPVAAEPTGPPPLPTVHRPLDVVVPPLLFGRGGGGGQAERDLRTILHMVAAIGVGLAALQIPASLPRAGEHAQLILRLIEARGFALGGGGGGSYLRPYAAVAAAQLTLALCAVVWAVWGILCVSLGARLRRTAIVTGWLALAAGLTMTVIAVTSRFDMQQREAVGWSGFRESRNVDLHLMLRGALLGLVHPMLMLALLTRPRVKDLFTRGSEAGEGEG
jgi:hypothetical protein